MIIFHNNDRDKKSVIAPDKIKHGASCDNKKCSCYCTLSVR